MIKKCKVTHIINPPIYGVVDKPIKEGFEGDLNCGQILKCMTQASVDEILSNGQLVRLDKDNYRLDNGSAVEELIIKDAAASTKPEEDTPVVNEDPTPEVKEEKPVEAPVIEDPVVPETVISEEDTPVVNEDPTPEVEEEKPVEAPVDTEVDTTPTDEVPHVKSTKKKNRK